MEEKSPILHKYYQSLCTSCGVCVAACPNDVLKLDLSPVKSSDVMKSQASIVKFKKRDVLYRVKL